MTVRPVGWFSKAYVQVRNERGTLDHFCAWSAWWTGEPTARPWRNADAFGREDCGTMGALMKSPDLDADEAADAAIRHALGTNAETRRLDGSWARASFRVQHGEPPRYRRPRVTRYSRIQMPGWDRPPEMSVADWRWTRRSAGPGWFRREPSVEFGALSSLGLSVGASEADVRRAFRQRARAAHPDGGGTAQTFQALVALRDAAMVAVRAR